MTREQENKWFAGILVGFVVIFITMMISVTAWAVHHNKAVVIETKMVEVEMLDIDPPKHVYIDLRDLSTGIVWKREYVSKHFNDWRKLEKGKPFLATRVTRKLVNQGDKIEVDWQDLRSGLEWTIKK